MGTTTTQNSVTLVQLFRGVLGKQTGRQDKTRPDNRQEKKREGETIYFLIHKNVQLNILIMITKVFWATGIYYSGHDLIHYPQRLCQPVLAHGLMHGRARTARTDSAVVSWSVERGFCFAVIVRR
jgi:hypothetical protein